jgi:hypothetical protein
LTSLTEGVILSDETSSHLVNMFSGETYSPGISAPYDNARQTHSPNNWRKHG